MTAEHERLTYIAYTDGIGAAMDFAARTILIYRTAIATPKHFASTKGYIEKFKESIDVFEKFLNHEIEA